MTNPVDPSLHPTPDRGMRPVRPRLVVVERRTRARVVAFVLIAVAVLAVVALLLIGALS